MIESKSMTNLQLISYFINTSLKYECMLGESTFALGVVFSSLENLKFKENLHLNIRCVINILQEMKET